MVFDLIKIMIVWLLFSTQCFAYALPVNLLEVSKLNLRFNKPSLNDKLSHVVIKDITQDKKGYIWIATNDGLNRYDGFENTIYRPSKSLSQSLSHFSINCLFVDNKGVLWVGTKGGLNRYNAKFDKFEAYDFAAKNDIELSSSNITKIFEDSYQRLWVGTQKGKVYRIAKNRVNYELININNSSQVSPFKINDIFESNRINIYIATEIGLLSYDNESNSLVIVDVKVSNKKINIHNNTTKIYKSSNGSILLGTTMGLYISNNVLGYYSPLLPKLFSKKIITAIHQYDKDYILVGTRASGLFLLNLNTLKVKQFENSNSEKFGLIDNQIYTIFRSRDGLFWIGTNLGINTVNTKQQLFGHLNSTNIGSTCLLGDTVYAMLVDSNKNLWLGAFGQGLSKINLITGKCETFTKLKASSKINEFKNVVSIFEDETGDIWIGTFDDGILKYVPGTDKFQYFSANKQSQNTISSNTISSNAISSIKGDMNGNVWIATYGGGLNKYNSLTHKFTNYIPRLKSTNSEVKIVNDVLMLQNGKLLLATQNYGLLRFDSEKNELTKYLMEKIQVGKIPPTLLSLDNDPDGSIWVGTRGYGAFQIDLKTESVQRISTEDGLLSNVVMRVQVDLEGNKWLYTDHGLTKISAKSQDLYTYIEADGLQSNQFTTTGFFESSDNILWTGGINGINRIELDKLSMRKLDNSPVITTFELHYKPVEISSIEVNSPLTQNINQTNEIKLGFEQNVFAFGFSSLEFKNAQRVKYAFKLEGYDNWNYVGASKHFANYTNIAPGEYVFRVKSTLGYNWDGKETSIKITITPPWWQTKIMYALYLILFLLVIYSTIYYRTRVLTKRSLLLEQSVQKRTEELASEKQKVEQLLSRKNEEFANVSHEFRTPLTLILGPLAQVLKTNQNQQELNRLNIVQRNGYRLLRMVDQLLNIETFRIKSITQKSPQAAGRIITFLTEAFSDLAREKNINLKAQHIVNINFEFTPDALEKIILNLLSNAIKYTKSGGTITVNSYRSPENELKIEVIDTGIGIPVDKLDSIFERYHRVLNESSEQVTGAGIGLSLVKSLVEAHQGRIEVESKLGEGSSITLFLPIINEVCDDKVNTYNNDEIIAMEIMSLTSQSLDSPQETINASSKNETNKPIILVIEDNEDMCNYIVTSISDEYKTITAKNGKEGVKIAITEVPDLIISDVMMPIMDGYQSTKELRQNNITSHIPIILLTARNDRESRLKGWFEKADEYITKPFDVDELKVRLKNLLDIRNILKKRFGETAFQTRDILFKGQSTKDNSSGVAENKNRMQQEFVTQLNEVLETLHAESSSSPAIIASAVAMSERQFYRKLKSILDMTPAEYLKRFRLEKAKRLLAEGKSVNYTAFEVGFSSQSYFGQCFKAQFGCTPSEYR